VRTATLTVNGTKVVEGDSQEPSHCSSR